MQSRGHLFPSRRLAGQVSESNAGMVSTYQAASSTHSALAKRQEVSTAVSVTSFSPWACNPHMRMGFLDLSHKDKTSISQKTLTLLLAP